MGHSHRSIQEVNMSMPSLLILLLIGSLTYSCNKKAFDDHGGKTFTCPDSGSVSSCDQHKCSIICSDHQEHVADCGSEKFASVSSSTNPDGSTTMQVLCTDEELQVEVEECFPFC